MLRRVLVLPYVAVCPDHQLALQHTCHCGAALRIFTKHTAPFCCYQCGTNWGDLPCQLVSGEYQALARQLLDWYTFFLTEGSPAIVGRALQLIDQHPIRQHGRLSEISSVAGELRKRSAYRRRLLPLPLGKLVASLVERDLVLEHSIHDYLSTGA